MDRSGTLHRARARLRRPYLDPLAHSYASLDERLAKLRYGKIMIMADQDQDGSHIKGLIINIFDHFWPGLLSQEGGESFLEQFVTPLIKARHGKKERVFYNAKDFEVWCSTAEAKKHPWRMRYYKGLGTSSSSEAREYFRNIDKHRIPFLWGGEDDGQLINMFFSKEQIAARKAWLKERMLAPTAVDGGGDEANLELVAQDSLATSSTTIGDFVNSELVSFAQADLLRAIPSVVDGLKPSQRKLLYACFKRNLTGHRELKVAQLAGYCAEHTNYHHGEASLHQTIVKMAQSYVGANNIPLLYVRSLPSEMCTKARPNGG